MAWRTADEGSDGESQDYELQPNTGGGSSAGVDGLMEGEATLAAKKKQKKQAQLPKTSSVSFGLIKVV